jgi:putative oxidoreductase
MPPPRLSRIAEIIGWVAAASRALERTGGPLVELLIRLWLARIFFVSAILKLASWQTALTLSRVEYPVSWMDPVVAAYLGVTIEFAGSILLAAGLASRFAAAVLFALSFVIQFSYLAVDMQLFWMLLFGWIVVRGAGPLSLDHLLRGGLHESALPFARAIIDGLQAFTRVAFPLYQLLLRLWLLLAAVLATRGTDTLASVVPLASAQHFASPSALVLLSLLGAGLATRVSALVLLAAIFTMTMMDLGESPDAYWAMAFALLALHGGGPFSLDALIGRFLAKRYPQLAGAAAYPLDGLPHVVIVGAGFGGISCAAALARVPVRVTLIDRHNYHLFQPLLYQVATTALSPGDIATPVRSLFREQFNTRVVLGTVTGIDIAGRTVQAGVKAIGFDYLVLATGAAHSYFGRDDWAPYAPGLKRVEDATEVRRRILSAFEAAEIAESEDERRALITFLIVGAGPTGVELAGAIAELARAGMQKEFRSFDPADARILLVESGPRVLAAFTESLSRHTQASLQRLGVEVMTNSKVEGIDAEGALVSGKRIAARTVLWAAGVAASPAATWLGAPGDRAGRLKVDADLSVPGFDGVFALGDTALVTAWKGKPVPGLAPAAKQQGIYVARRIRATVLRRPPPPPFRYRHLGSLATIGRRSAVADFGFLRLWGAPAWWLWGAIHVFFLVGVRNRVSVVLDWFWSYLTFKSGTRLITGTDTLSPTAATPAGRGGTA